MIFRDRRATRRSRRRTLAPTTALDGFVTFYDGTSVIAQVPLVSNQAQFTNTFAGGSHRFSAVYSGDGVHQSSTDEKTIDVLAPADAVFYDAFKVPPGS